MEWLAVATRQQRLLGTGRCGSCSLRRPFSSSQAGRSYAFTPSSRRMTGREKTTEADIDSPGSTEPRQAYPLAGYYHDILVGESPYRGHAPTSRPVPSSPSSAEPQAQTQAAQAQNPRDMRPRGPLPTAPVEPQSPEDKMSVVFGSRLQSPGRSSRYDPGTVPPESTWKTVNGVTIPPRPSEPDNCCMSGCAHCVWDDYRDDMESWLERIEEAKAKAAPTGPTPDMRQSPRPEVDSASTSMDDDGGGSDTNWPVPEPTEDVFANIPVGIREFMKTEKKLKQKHREASA